MGRQIEDHYNSLSPEERERQYGARLVHNPAPARPDLGAQMQALAKYDDHPMLRSKRAIDIGSTVVHMTTAGVYKIVGIPTLQIRQGWHDNAKIVLHQLLVDGAICWIGADTYDLLIEGRGSRTLLTLPVWLQASAPLTVGNSLPFILYASHVLGEPPKLFLRERVEFTERFALLTGGEG